MNVSVKAKWKSVPLDSQLMAKGFAEGLMGIEELCDYSLTTVKNSKKRSNVTKIAAGKVVSGKKRPVNAQMFGDNEIADGEPKKKKKKTRQKRKPKERKRKPKPAKEKVPEKLPNGDSQVLSDEDQVELEGWRDLFVPKAVMKALKELNFETPTPIQRETLPAAISGHADVVGAAETGSGKTLAFAIPIIHGILCDKEREAVERAETPEASEPSSEEESDMSEPEADTGCVRVINDIEFDFDVDIIPGEAGAPKSIRKNKRGKLRALVLTPTRELAIQVKNHFQAVAKHADIKAIAVVGGMAPQKQIRQLDSGPEVIVATPGRLWDLVQEGHPHLANLTGSVRYLAIDETDRMVEKGHFEELTNLLAVLNSDAAAMKRRQTFVFSATLSLVHELPKHAKKSSAKKKMSPEEKLRRVTEMIGVKDRPKIVDLTRKVGTAETLTESRIHCDSTEKDFYLYYFLNQHPGRTMVFCNSIDCVRRLVNLFGLLWCEPLGLHAQMHQKQRLKNLERFAGCEERGRQAFLIATDVAARGLDIPDVEHVVHYQVPRTSESYIHRSGRTARASKKGLSVMLIDSSENLLYRRMCRTLNRDEDLPAFPVDDSVLRGVKVRVNTARDLDKLMLATKKEELSKSWLKKAAEEAELELSESDPENEFGEAKTKVKAVSKAKTKAKRAELNNLLAAPLHSHGYAGKYPTMSGKLKFPTEFRAVADDRNSALDAVAKSKAELKDLMKAAPVKTNRNKGKKFRKKKKNRPKQ